MSQLLMRRFGDLDYPSPREVGDLFSESSVKTILEQSSLRLTGGDQCPVPPINRELPADSKEDRASAAIGESKSDSGAKRFRIIKHHAQGGLGVVYLAEDTQVRRHVAIKQIQERHADVPAYREKFRFEAEVTGQLEHPGIVPIYALGDDESGRPYYAIH